MSFSTFSRYLKSKPLVPIQLLSHKTKSNRTINFSLYGQKENQKVKYVAIYFHASPMCRLEPNLHSNSNDINVYELLGIRLYCFERPGFGDSQLYESNVLNFVNDVVDIIEQEIINLPVSKVLNIGYSAGGPYALTFHHVYPSKILASTIIASSVSSAMDNVYHKSFRGQIETLFFKSPIAFQKLLYYILVQSFLHGLNVPIYFLRLLNYFNINKADAGQVLVKLLCIRDTLYHATHTNGIDGLVTDTIVTQSIDFPWYKHNNNVNDMNSNSTSVTKSLSFPPISLYYSKQDSTVPWSSGVRLKAYLDTFQSTHNKSNGSLELHFIDGGHACFYLHLDTILKNLVNKIK